MRRLRRYADAVEDEDDRLERDPVDRRAPARIALDMRPRGGGLRGLSRHHELEAPAAAALKHLVLRGELAEVGERLFAAPVFYQAVAPREIFRVGGDVFFLSAR